MTKFAFTQDIKQTIWTRNSFNIEAETEEEARAIAAKILAKDDDVSFMDAANIEFVSEEMLYDTSEYMTPEENGNQPTNEIYFGRGDEMNKEGNFIGSNCPGADEK